MCQNLLQSCWLVVIWYIYKGDQDNFKCMFFFGKKIGFFNSLSDTQQHFLFPQGRNEPVIIKFFFSFLHVTSPCTYFANVLTVTDGRSQFRSSVLFLVKIYKIKTQLFNNNNPCAEMFWIALDGAQGQRQYSGDGGYSSLSQDKFMRAAEGNMMKLHASLWGIRIYKSH